MAITDIVDEDAITDESDAPDLSSLTGILNALGNEPELQRLSGTTDTQFTFAPQELAEKYIKPDLSLTPVQYEWLKKQVLSFAQHYTVSHYFKENRVNLAACVALLQLTDQYGYGSDTVRLQQILEEIGAEHTGPSGNPFVPTGQLVAMARQIGTFQEQEAPPPPLPIVEEPSEEEAGRITSVNAILDAVARGDKTLRDRMNSTLLNHLPEEIYVTQEELDQIGAAIAEELRTQNTGAFFGAHRLTARFAIELLKHGHGFTQAQQATTIEPAIAETLKNWMNNGKNPSDHITTEQVLTEINRRLNAEAKGTNSTAKVNWDFSLPDSHSDNTAEELEKAEEDPAQTLYRLTEIAAAIDGLEPPLLERVKQWGNQLSNDIYIEEFTATLRKQVLASAKALSRTAPEDFTFTEAQLLEALEETVKNSLQRNSSQEWSYTIQRLYANFRKGIQTTTHLPQPACANVAELEALFEDILPGLDLKQHPWLGEYTPGTAATTSTWIIRDRAHYVFSRHSGDTLTPPVSETELYIALKKATQNSMGLALWRGETFYQEFLKELNLPQRLTPNPQIIERANALRLLDRKFFDAVENDSSFETPSRSIMPAAGEEILRYGTLEGWWANLAPELLQLGITGDLLDQKVTVDLTDIDGNLTGEKKSGHALTLALRCAAATALEYENTSLREEAFRTAFLQELEELQVIEAGTVNRLNQKKSTGSAKLASKLLHSNTAIFRDINLAEALEITEGLAATQETLLAWITQDDEFPAIRKLFTQNPDPDTAFREASERLTNSSAFVGFDADGWSALIRVHSNDLFDIIDRLDVAIPVEVPDATPDVVLAAATLMMIDKTRFLEKDIAMLDDDNLLVEFKKLGSKGFAEHLKHEYLRQIDHDNGLTIGHAEDLAKNAWKMEFEVEEPVKKKTRTRQTQDVPNDVPDPENTPQQDDEEKKVAFGQVAAVHVGGLIGIGIAIKEFFIGKKDPETGKREDPGIVKKLLGGGIILTLAVLIFKFGGYGQKIAFQRANTGGRENGI